MKHILVYSLSLLISLLAPLVQADVKDIRIWQYPDKTKLVFDLTEPASHKVFTLSNPDRVVIDFTNLRLLKTTADIELDGTAVTAIRTGEQKGNVIRVVLDTAETLLPSSYTIPPNEKYPDHRLVIDLKRPGTAQSVSATRKVAPARNASRSLIVAIDAGHGGEDPGAIGARKNREKQVVLAIAKELQVLLQKDPAYTPFMVRTGDYYVGLRERSDKARAANADLFVSIHADAFVNPQAHGASVYVLSDRGATSETARWLADKENESDLIGGISLDDKEDHVRMTLLDLSMTYQRNASMGVADSILGHLGGVARLHKKSVEQAAFVVLKSPDMPALLVETGFISNPDEERKLTTQAYQRQIANAIYSGIRDYFRKHPAAAAPAPVLQQASAIELEPENLVVASNNRVLADLPPDLAPMNSRPVMAQTPAAASTLTPAGSGTRDYVIRRGDTLSEIAAQHRVGISELRRLNGLRSDQIRIGQTIKIPGA